MTAATNGLFVIWEAALHRRDRILDDLGGRFDIIDVFEVYWTPSRVMENFWRFYSDIDVRGVYHIFNKGSGPFVLAIVRDNSPVIESRGTSRGARIVNARFLEAKQSYRNWTGGLEVHCSETPDEARRDSRMLLGMDIDRVRRRPPAAGRRIPPLRRLQRDLSGATGWSSCAELLDTLNQGTRYALLYHRERPPFGGGDGEQAGIELLTDDFPALHRILNARPAVETAPHGGRFTVAVGTGRLALSLRFPGDGYFDAGQARRMLRNRVYDAAGYFRLSDDDYVDALRCRARIRRPTAGERVHAAGRRIAGTGLVIWRHWRDRVLLRMPWIRSLKQSLSGFVTRSSLP